MIQPYTVNLRRDYAMHICVIHIKYWSRCWLGLFFSFSSTYFFLWKKGLFSGGVFALVSSSRKRLFNQSAMRHSDFQSHFEDGTEVKISSDINPPLHIFDYWFQNCNGERYSIEQKKYRKQRNNYFKDLQHIIEYVSLNL